MTEDYSAFLEKEREVSLNDRDMDVNAQGPLVPRTFPGGLLFHCAQGKDRTGILSMLLCFVLYGDGAEVEDRAVAEYAASEALLRRGQQGSSATNTNGRASEEVGDGGSKKNTVSVKDKGREGSTNLGEIQSLKGSPPEALRDTLSRLRARHGGVTGYLDSIGFNKDFRKRFKAAAARSKTLVSEIRKIRETGQ